MLVLAGGAIPPAPGGTSQYSMISAWLKHVHEHSSPVRISVSVALCPPPPDPAVIFSEGGEIIKLHNEGPLTIRTTGIKRVYI